MDAEDRTAALSNFNPDAIDVEFLPFLERINRFPHVVSMQCCLGHVNYESRCDEGAKQSGRWGYLQLLLDLDLAEWLAEEVRNCDWLLLGRSQTWDEQAGIAPGVTENESYVLTFAWDACEWPRPAEEICTFIEEYHYKDHMCRSESADGSEAVAYSSVHDDNFVLASP